MSTLKETLEDVQDMYSTLSDTILSMTQEQVEAEMNGNGTLSDDDKSRLDTFMRRRINAGMTAFSWSSMNLDTNSVNPNW